MTGIGTGGTGGACLLRTTINARPPRTVQDAARDPLDYFVGPDGETGPQAVARWQMNTPLRDRKVDLAVWVVFWVFVVLFGLGVI